MSLYGISTVHLYGASLLDLSRQDYFSIGFDWILLRVHTKYCILVFLESMASSTLLCEKKVSPPVVLKYFTIINTTYHFESISIELY